MLEDAWLSSKELFEKKSTMQVISSRSAATYCKPNTSGNAKHKNKRDPPLNHSISQNAHLQVSALTANPEENNVISSQFLKMRGIHYLPATMGPTAGPETAEILQIQD